MKFDWSSLKVKLLKLKCFEILEVWNVKHMFYVVLRVCAGDENLHVWLLNQCIMIFTDLTQNVINFKQKNWNLTHF
jgi:hypothetical protein